MRKNYFPDPITFYVMSIYNRINKGEKKTIYMYIFTLHFYSMLEVVSLDAE